MSVSLLDLLCLSLRLHNKNTFRVSDRDKTADDWSVIHQEAREQAVLGVAFDGMQQLVEQGQSEIDRVLMLGWFGEVQQIEQQNEVVNVALRELVELYCKAGIPFVVMKGQTVGAVYPNPMRRQSGDIDVFVWEEQAEARMIKTGGEDKHTAYERACMLLQKQGGVLDEVAPEKHAEFSFRGVVVEVHHTLLDMFCPSALRYLEHLDYRQVIEMHEVAGIQVPCFKPMFNGVYMLGHMVHHLLTEGLGLRQVCDWMLLMKRLEQHCVHKDSSVPDLQEKTVNGVPPSYIYNNVEELKRHLEKLHLTEAFSVFVQLGVLHFGLDVACWRWAFLSYSEKEAEKLLAYMMESGNFGRKTMAKKRDSSLANNVSNAWLYFRHLLTLRRIAPAEVRWFFPVRVHRWMQKGRFKNH